jgi:predicted Zn-dependent protease
MRLKNPISGIVYLFLACFLLNACHANGSGKLPPKNLETRAGDEMHRQILSNFYVYTEPDVNRYVSEVGEKLSRFSKRRDLQYEVTILYDDKIFATSIPGGKIYITTGLLAFLENETELAGVLAHEIAELQYHEPALSRSRKVSSGLAQGAALAAPFFGSIGALAFLGVTGVNAVANHEKSKDERVIQADKLALRYLVQAGYDPQGCLDVLYRMVDLNPQDTYLISDFYWNRPISLKRMKRLKEEFKKLPLKGMSFSAHREVFLENMKPVREIYKKSIG